MILRGWDVANRLVRRYLPPIVLKGSATERQGIATPRIFFAFGALSRLVAPTFCTLGGGLHRWPWLGRGVPPFGAGLPPTVGLFVLAPCPVSGHRFGPAVVIACPAVPVAEPFGGVAGG